MRHAHGLDDDWEWSSRWSRHCGRHRPGRRSMWSAPDSPDCATIGRTDGGYGNVFQQSFWNMAAGHNCTNYVAYRLTHGRLVARPPGTDSAADVGPGGGGGGRPGRRRADRRRCRLVGCRRRWSVGDVGPCRIRRGDRARRRCWSSEDNLRGDFRWRLMTRLDGTWPSGSSTTRRRTARRAGEFTSVTSPEAGKLDFWGSAMDPDAADANRSVRRDPRWAARHVGRRGIHVPERVLPVPPDQQRRHARPDHDVPVRPERAGHSRARTCCSDSRT